MERGEDAERMAEAYKNNPPKFQGKRLTVYMSRKYKQLKHGWASCPSTAHDMFVTVSVDHSMYRYVCEHDYCSLRPLRHRPPSPEPEEKRPAKRERSAAEGQTTSDSPVKPAAKKDDQPPAKKLKEEKEAEQQETAEASTAEVPSEQVDKEEEEKKEEEEEEETEKEEKQEGTDEQKMDAAEEVNICNLFISVHSPSEMFL